MINLLRGMLACGLILVLAGVARSGELIVDQKNARADDKNPGTLELPFKTIQAALDKAQPGDTVQVRGGVYHESVKFKHSGTNDAGVILERDFDLNAIRWITLEAYKDEHVALDGSVAIPAGKWELVKGCKNTYSAPFPLTEPWGPTMVREGDIIIKKVLDPKSVDRPVPVMPGDGPADKGCYYDYKQARLFVNMAGRVPGKDGEVRAAQLNLGVFAANQSYIRIRKLEIRHFSDVAIDLNASREFMVEDNYVHDCHSFVFGQPTTGGMIRRNTFADTFTGGGLSLSYAHGTIVEGNIIRGFHAECGWMGGGVICNKAFGLVIRHNIFVGDDVVTGAAVWPDCGAFGIAIYGNTIYRIGFSGVYIEAETQGASVFWNTAFDCSGQGICFRTNRSNTCFENYVFGNHGGGLSISWCATGVANMMMRNWVIDNDGPGAALTEVEPLKFPPPDPSKAEVIHVFKFNMDPPKSTPHVLDHNVYKLRPDSSLFRYENKLYKDIAPVRSELGQEMHGEVVKDFDPASLGLVTFRVPGTKKSWEPVPMFGNPHSGRSVDSMPLEERYFWRQGTFRGAEAGGWGSGPFDSATRANSDGYLRVQGEYSNDFPGHARPDGICCLQVGSLAGKTMSADGLGYWSVDLPTVDGAQIDLSLWIRAHEIKPVNGNGGLFALAEFCDETGQNVTRQFLAGAEDGQKAVGADWTLGTYAYRKLAVMVTAPKGARWFKLGFGLRNCSGWAAFDEMDIQTRPGTPEKEAPKAPPPIDTVKFVWTPCDLTGLLNRPLTDEVDNDGKGGWTDQGPTMDLRDLRAGDCVFNNVAFRVAKGNACFIMKNKMRPSQNLPDGGKVDFKGKADVLAFLHSGGWLAAGVRHATYVIHYADGQTAEIPVIAGKNIFDWTTPPTAMEGLKYDPALGFTQHATAVAVPAFVFGHVWMTLWKNPHPDKQIVSLEVKGANEGIPGLIAVSRGIMKK
jgi:hypothetical protein